MPGRWNPDPVEEPTALDCHCADDDAYDCARARDLRAPTCGCRCHWAGTDNPAPSSFKSRRYEGWTPPSR